MRCGRSSNACAAAAAPRCWAGRSRPMRARCGACRWPPTAASAWASPCATAATSPIPRRPRCGWRRSSPNAASPGRCANVAADRRRRWRSWLRPCSMSTPRLLPPLAGEGWGGGLAASMLSPAPSARPHPPSAPSPASGGREGRNPLPARSHRISAMFKNILAGRIQALQPAASLMLEPAASLMFPPPLAGEGWGGGLPAAPGGWGGGGPSPPRRRPPRRRRASIRLRHLPPRTGEGKDRGRCCIGRGERDGQYRLPPAEHRSCGNGCSLSWRCIRPDACAGIGMATGAAGHRDPRREHLHRFQREGLRRHHAPRLRPPAARTAVRACPCAARA